MQKAEKELIEEKIKGVLLHQQANYDLINIQLEKILNGVTLTNGRVTSIEKQTKIGRFLETHPKISIIIFVGVYFLLQSFALTDIINLFK